MIFKGDTTRPHSVKAKFDQDFHASPYGGGILVERVMRRLGLYHYLKTNLPARSSSCDYKTEDFAYATIASMLLGGNGISGIDKIRFNKTSCKIFGLKEGALSPSTAYRCLCHLAGLPERSFEEVYRKAEAAQTRLELGGKECPETQMHRIVPEEPEWATQASLESLRTFLGKTARRCIRTLRRSIMRLHGWYVAFGDGTDLQVKGKCFDAARKDRNGDKILRLMLLMLGPITVGHDLLPGNMDEGCWLPNLLKRSRKVIADTIGKKSKVLTLLDGAFFEKSVVKELKKNQWNYIICANQQRDFLETLAASQPDIVWRETGADASRGWRCSQVCTLLHTPKGWEEPVNIVCRRWQKDDEIEGLWRYSFVSTDIEPTQMPVKLMKKYGYGQSVWMLYSTKQGRENHLKTPLRDLGLHHPPSCRLGVNQSFYALALAASNLAMVLRYRVMPEDTYGMHLYKIRDFFVTIAGYIRYHANTLTVYLAGGDVPLWMQNLWRQAFVEAGRL